MPNQDRPSRPRRDDKDRKPRSGGTAGGASRSGKPASGGRGAAGAGGGRPAGGRPGNRDEVPFSRPRAERRDGGESRSWDRGDKRGDDRRDNRSGSRSDSRRDDRGSRDDRPRSVDQAKYDGPPLDESISGNELDRNITQQLRGLPEKLAARVARHLVAAGLLMESDPVTAYQHTLAARARAARIAVVREACGEAAYAAGEFAEALAELRAAKRMNGSQDYLHVMADCERALGRPDRALALARNPSVVNFEADQKAEMTIVEAGARRDLGELDAALRTLENAPLRSKSREDWVVRLRYAYADTLLAAGRRDDAVEWFHRTLAIDADEITDAEERVMELERTAPRPPADKPAEPGS